MAAIFTLEGNIGAGKSTLINLLEHAKFNKKHIVMLEPVDKWLNTRPHPDAPSIFEMYYNDKQKYGFLFQMFALQSRMDHLNKVMQENQDNIIICERCFLTDFEIFASMLHSQKVINDAEYFVYKAWYDFVMSIIQPKIKGIIYLAVEPEICVKRIIQRDRKGEENIDIAYIKQLHKQHESWLNNQEQHPILRVDGNGECQDISPIIEFVNCNTAYP